jgi:hypothetical protein
MVDDAVTLKRSQPAARGSAHPIRKRASHIFIRLAVVAPPPSLGAMAGKQSKKTGRNAKKVEKVTVERIEKEKEGAEASKKTLVKKTKGKTS